MKAPLSLKGVAWAGGLCLAGTGVWKFAVSDSAVEHAPPVSIAQAVPVENVDNAAHRPTPDSPHDRPTVRPDRPITTKPLGPIRKRDHPNGEVPRKKRPMKPAG